MRSTELQDFITHVLDPNAGDRNLALFDSWSAFRNKERIDDAMSDEHKLDLMLIPEGTTGMYLEIFVFPKINSLLKPR